MSALATGRDCRVALLERLIDHAPMFPPASLPLEQALAEDSWAQQSAYAWMLGRLVVPAAAVPEIPFGERGLSVVVNAPYASDSRVEALEIPPGSEYEGDAAIPEVYVEIPLVGDVAAALADLRVRGLRAKVRCGGAAQPSVESLARFVRTCRALELPFKATAGLHHPVRRGDEHGFLNLLSAAVFGDEEAVLVEAVPEAFSLTADSLRWRDREAGADELAAVRQGLLVSIGSCSFREPVDDLTALGIFPL
jgi:hypothetical protein